MNDPSTRLLCLGRLCRSGEIAVHGEHYLFRQLTGAALERKQGLRDRPHIRRGNRRVLEVRARHVSRGDMKYCELCTPGAYVESSAASTCKSCGFTLSLRRPAPRSATIARAGASKMRCIRSNAEFALLARSPARPPRTVSFASKAHSHRRRAPCSAGVAARS
jgi:hypothetical protein